MMEANIALARAMGDETLLASFEKPWSGGSRKSEAEGGRSLGKNNKGIGARASAPIDKKTHLSDPTMNVLPIRPFKVYLRSNLSGSTGIKP